MPAAEPGPAVSVCIVNWNTRDLLRDCLRSIAKRTRVAHEVIVVDNSSEDGSADMVRAEFPGVRLIASPENLGFVRGNNLAGREARGEFLFLLNPDTVLQSDAVSGLHAVMAADPSIGAAGCKLLNADGSVQTVCAGTYPTPWNEFTSLLWLHRIAPRLFPNRELDAWDHLDDRDVECLSGACIMIRKRTWDELGGFDERIFMYAEDVDLCHRVRRAGLRIRYLAGESIVHFAGSASGRRRESFFAVLSQLHANEYVLAKHFGKGRAARYRAAVFTGSLVRLVAATLAAPLLWIGGTRPPGEVLRKSAATLRWSVSGGAPQRA